MPGEEIPGSGVMTVAVAKEAAENNADCIGFCLPATSFLQPEARCWISLLGPAGTNAAAGKQRDSSPSRRPAAGSGTAAVRNRGTAGAIPAPTHPNEVGILDGGLGSWGRMWWILVLIAFL